MSKSSTTTKGVPTPNRVTTHPGEVLSEEFLKPFGMSASALAIALRVPATRIGAIIKGERAMHGGYCLTARPLLRHECRVLDEHAGEVND